MVKAACETDMAVDVFAEAEAKNFHDVLQGWLITPMTTACFDSSAALHRTDSGALRAGCYREAITSHDVEVKGLLSENRNRIRTYPRQTRERGGYRPRLHLLLFLSDSDILAPHTSHMKVNRNESVHEMPSSKRTRRFCPFEDNFRQEAVVVQGMHKPSHPRKAKRRS